ncbi:MAG: glycosyltransferase family 39 protein [Gemmatimonadaceae bacterium]|nr:glycosyltransferase family 39 protein [Gemmatimonadaceae bacterium]
MRVPIWRPGIPTVCLVLCLVLGFSLRFVGLTRGDSSLEERAFHHFHPDETTIVQTALKPIEPFSPELTCYGLLPVYLLRGVLEFNRIVFGWDFEDQGSTDSVRYVYLTARILAALVSCLTLYLVWLLGHRWFGELAGLLATLVVAVAPMAIQSAHFYTVDGLFTLLILAALLSLFHALEGDDRRWWVATGALTGVAGAVRLAGLSVGAMVPVGLLIYHRRRLGAVLTSSVWLAGLAGLLSLLVLQPYLVTDWELLLQSRSVNDFNYAMKVARGEYLTAWSLVDVHTIPYLHHWSHLWPLGVGWPLTVSFGLAIASGLWRADRRKGLLLLWVGIHFALIGGLLTKPTRYLLPMLPFLAILTADLCVWLVHSPRLLRVRKLAIAATAAVLVHSAGYGIAFAGIYAREDSRIEAARWMEERIPDDSRIGVEQGAFTMRGLVGNRHRSRLLGTSQLFSMRGYATCGTELTWLRPYFEDLDYLAIIEANRYQQFTAVPDLIPGAAAFYQALADGDLGFDLVHRVERYPTLGGLEFRDDGSDPSFTGYDHPVVSIFRMRDDASWQEAWERLRTSLSASAHCVDPYLERAGAAIEAGDLSQGLSWARMAARRVPENRIAPLIEAHLLARMGGPDREASEAHHTELLEPHRIPADAALATGMSLFELGLKELAVSALETGVSATIEDDRVPREPMARIYMRLASRLKEELELEEEADEVLLMATRLHPLPGAYNRLARGALEKEHYGPAAEYLQQSLRLNPEQAGVHATLGQIAAEVDDPATALRHFRKALELNPDLEDRLSPWITVHRD